MSWIRMLPSSGSTNTASVSGFQSRSAGVTKYLPPLWTSSVKPVYLYGKSPVRDREANTGSD